ncbi:MAG: phage terminase large subunit family protein [Nitrospira sp.]|nr:phage terminase large subunit family protein [Nitrospira sp.]
MDATYAAPSDLRAVFFAGLRPDPSKTVAEWSDECVRLPSFASESGPWRTSRTPFLKEIMECLSPRHPCKKVSFIKPVQIGGTQIAVNWVGYTMACSPSAMLFYEPIIDMVKRLTKEKLDPMINATPALRGKVKEARSRDSGNTMFRKEFMGGFLNLLWSNSSAAARSTSAPRIVLDEVDEYEQDVGDQGHPCDIIEKRAASYPRYKIFELSTPTADETSRILKQYTIGSQGRYHVPCPFCQHLQPLEWERLIYTFDGVRDPERAAYQCCACGDLIPDQHKTWMMDSSRAQWVHTYPERVNEHASFHLNLLYQPYGWAYPWTRLAREYSAAYEKMKVGDVRPMKTFTNTMLAKTWKERLDKVEHNSLYHRREIYEATCPRGVVVLFASVDVQDDRLEAGIRGFGVGEESWGIEYHIFYGSPALESVWDELTEWLQSARTHADGVSIHVEAVGVDTGGHHTKEAYRFIEQYRGVAFALKGSSAQGAPDVPMRQPKAHRNFRFRLYLLGTVALKDTIFSRLKISEHGPGYMHFPQRDGYDEEYFKGLASEVKKPKYRPRSHVQIGYSYEKVYTRNEPLDLEVYALATMQIWIRHRRVTLDRMAAAWVRKVEQAKARDAAQVQSSGVPAPALPSVTSTTARPGRRVISQGVL